MSNRTDLLDHPDLSKVWVTLESEAPTLDIDDMVSIASKPSARPARRSRGRLIAIAAAFLVALFIVGPPTSLTSAVLAYEYADGTYTYDVSYRSLPVTEADPEWTEANGILTYTVEENSQARTTSVSVEAIVTDLDLYCPHDACPEDLALFSDIPVIRFVLDDTGRYVQTPAPADVDEYPELVLPDPLPGSTLYAGLPFGFGPPFPEHALEVGDTWTTTDPPSASDDVAPQFSAEHTVIDQDSIAGRNTVVIESTYQGQTGGGGFPTTSKVTVWFDPEAGIIVRAELNRSMHTPGEEEIGNRVEIVVDLTRDR